MVNGGAATSYIQPVRIDREVKRRFASRCVRLGIYQKDVLVALVGAFNRGVVDEEVGWARK